MSKHTPGPWVLDVEVITTESDRNTVVALLGAVDQSAKIPELYLCGEQAKANGKLMAASPDLLKALKELRDWYQETTGLPACNANAAINKAEKEE